VLLRVYWRQLRYGHAECESHACCGVRVRAAPSSEGSVTGSLRWGQLQCGHFVCESHACRGAWMRAAALSGTAGRIRTRGACSRGCHVLRESKICACRGLVACCVFFGRCRMAPGSGVILRGRHAPCDNQPIATNVSALNLLRGIPASRTSLGRSGETRPLTGLWADVAHDANDQATSLSRVGVRTLRRRQLRVRPPSGGAIPELC